MSETIYPSPAILAMKPGEHFCCIYQTEAEHRLLITAYLRSGLEQGQKIIYITDTHSPDTILGYLRDDGLEVEPFLESGQLAFKDAFETYLRDGEFDPERMLEQIRQDTQAALEEGFRALRMTGEMTWLLRGLPGSDRVLEYESRLNAALHDRACMAICQFDRRMFEPELLLGIIAVHPQVIVGTEILENSFFIAPQQLMGSEAAPAVLENVLADMRERTMASRRVQEREAFTASALDMLRDVFVVLDMEAHILYKNAAVNRVTGYTDEEVHTLPLSRFFSEEDAPVVLENFNRCAAEGSTTFTVNLLAKNGVTVPMEFQGTLLQDAAGNPYSLCIMGRDITEHVEVRDTLREERDLAEGYLDLAGVIILVLDEDGRVSLLNRHACNLLGYSEEEVAGVDWCEVFVPEESREDVRAVFRHLQRGEPGFEYYENDIQTRSGERRLVGWNNICLQNEFGGFAGTLSSGMDITQSRKDQQRLAWQSSANAAVAEVSATLLSGSDTDEVSEMMLGHLRRLTDSADGFIGYIDPVTGHMVSPTMTRSTWAVCDVADKSAIFEKFSGLWGWVLKNQEPLLTNSPQDDPRSSGVPEGHVPIRRFLAVPALVGGNLVGLIALANSARDYERRDLELVTRMATHYALAIERNRMEQDLKDAHNKLQLWVGELEQRGQELSLLNEMGNLLQTCQTVGEAHFVVDQFAEKLFSGISGAIYYLNDVSGVFEMATEWGSTGEADPAFSRNDCWALRRGQIHCVQDMHAGLLCTHLGEPRPSRYICSPMIAQGETLGVLHLRCRAEENACEMIVGEDASGHMNNLAMTFSGHVALALVNLRLSESLRDQAVRDGLTNVFNRRFMEESLVREIAKAKRSLSPLSVVMLDLDYFKQFNDEFGHEAGDVMLQKFADLMRASFREADVVCRYGGDEFVLMLPGASLDFARARTEQMQESLRGTTIQYRGRILRALTMSAGLATLPDHGLTGEELLNAADKALYCAKNEGRDRLVIAEPLGNEAALAEEATPENPSESAA